MHAAEGNVILAKGDFQMIKRVTGSMITVTGLVLFAAVPAAGQTPAPTAKTWQPPRTTDGQPDIQGFWSRGTGQASPSHSVEEGSEPLAFIIQGRDPRTARLNVIVDPADKKIPYQPWAAAKRKEKLENLFAPTTREHIDPDDQCLLNGAPRTMYSPGAFQIVQTPGHVMFFFANSHAYRIIPTDGRPHLGKDVKLWQGNSRGRWEGNTLVVDVTNQNDRTWFDSHGTFHSNAVHVVERYTFVDPDTIRYEARIEDPTVFTRPWTLALPLRRNKETGIELWEEACHEGERSVEHMLDAGRIAREKGITGIHSHELDK